MFTKLVLDAMVTDLGVSVGLHSYLTGARAGAGCHLNDASHIERREENRSGEP